MPNVSKELKQGKYYKRACELVYGCREVCFTVSQMATFMQDWEYTVKLVKKGLAKRNDERRSNSKTS